MNIRTSLYTPGQVQANPQLKQKAPVDLAAFKEQIQDNQGILAEGPQEINLKIDSKRVINLKFEVGVNGATRKDFLTAVGQALAQSEALTPEQIGIKQGLASIYHTLSQKHGIHVDNEQELTPKMEALEQRFERLTKTSDALQVTETRDHHTRFVKRAEIRHKAGDGVPFAEQRQMLLRKCFPELENHHQLLGFGLLTAKNNEEVEKQRGLRQANPHSTTYLRDAHSGLKDFFSEVCAKTGIEQSEQTDKRVLVNSPRVAERLKDLLGPICNELFDGDIQVHPVPGQPGLCVLDYKLKAGELVNRILDTKDRGELLTKALDTLGATPSTYVALAYLHPGQAVPPDDGVDNYEALHQLTQRPALKDIQALALQDNGIGALAQTATHLIEGLPAALGEQRRNPVIANSLEQIGNLMEVMAISGDHPEQFSRTLNFLIEEVSLVLGQAKPFTAKDYVESVSAIQAKRLPVLQALAEVHSADEAPVKQQQIVALSSGMDAISTAFAAARKLNPDTPVEQFEDEHNLNYFEVPTLLKEGRINQGNQPIITASLNPSTPDAAMDMNALKSLVKTRCESHNPTTLILDITIEQDNHKLNDLISGLQDELKSGNLNLILCKSYQKYASLGSGKLMAGNLTVINNGDPKFDPCNTYVKDCAKDLGLLEEAQGALRRDESQLMTYLLRQTSSDELGLIKDASAKARFINDFCWPPHYDDDNKALDANQLQDLPFVLRRSNLFFSQANLGPLGVELRDSFSFFNSSFLTAGSSLRINAGHETEARMVEQFFAIGNLAGMGGAAWAADATTLVSKLVQTELLSAPAMSAHLQTLSQVDAQVLKTGSAGDILQRLDQPGPELTAFVENFVKLRGADELEPEQVIERALIEIRGGAESFAAIKTRQDFIDRPDFTEQRDLLTQVQEATLKSAQAIDILLGLAPITAERRDFVEHFVALRDNQQTPQQIFDAVKQEFLAAQNPDAQQGALLCAPQRVAHLERLVQVQAETLRTGSVPAILEQLVQPSEELTHFVHQFVALRGDSQQLPQDLLLSLEQGLNQKSVDFQHKVALLRNPQAEAQLLALGQVGETAKTKGSQEILAALQPGVTPELRSFVDTYIQLRGEPALTPAALEKKLKRELGSMTLPTEQQTLELMQKYQASVKASFLHYAFTHIQPVTDFLPHAEALIANQFKGQAPDSEAVSPSTRTAIVKAWASHALGQLDPPDDLVSESNQLSAYQQNFARSAELLEAGLADLPPYERLKLLQGLDHERFAKMPQEHQLKLAGLLTAQVEVDESFELLQDLHLKGEAAKATALLTGLDQQGPVFPSHKGLLEAIDTPEQVADWSLPLGRARLLLDPEAGGHGLALSGVQLNQLIEGDAQQILGALGNPEGHLQAFVNQVNDLQTRGNYSFKEAALTLFPNASLHVQALKDLNQEQLLKTGSEQDILQALNAPSLEFEKFVRLFVAVRGDSPFTPEAYFKRPLI